MTEQSMGVTDPTATMSAFTPSLTGMSINRRSLLKGVAGAALLAGGVSSLAACTGAKAPAANAPASKSATLGSGSSDAVPKKATAAMVAAFEKKSGDTVKINTVPHNDFQNNINSYLQGSPDDVFTWFAGYRMRYYASKGLVAPLDDVWEKIGPTMGEAVTKASTGDDGKKYLVPLLNYPWGFFFRKSVWQQKGYTEPKTFDELKTLCAKMKKDGLIPIAFGDKDGWPAMGTFDYLNMRLNGYQFHVDLCAHKESWDQQKVKDVFDNWKAILPYHDPNALGATWQEAAQTLAQKKTGMYLLGSFVTQQFSDKATLADIDFFPFPEMAAEGRDAVEAPIDGWMVTKKGGDNQAAKDLVQFIGTPEGSDVYQSLDPSNLPVVKGADLSKLTPLNKKCSEVIAAANSISQFLDRDALPAMANNVMIPALQGFIKNQTIDTSNLEKQAKSLYAAQ
jgi:multiple sugar transport system substrate-binding protein